MNTNANDYVTSIGSQQEQVAARQLRILMDKYTRAKLLSHINAANLGENKSAFLDFISARQHLSELAQQNWPQMAQRFGKDENFQQQALAMSLFLTQVDCTEDPNFHLDSPELDRTGVSNVMHKLKSAFMPAPEPVIHSAQYRALTFDPNNFDDSPPSSEKATSINQLLRQPLVLGGFIFGLLCLLSLGALRVLHLSRRKPTQPPSLKGVTSNFPVLIFDGITPRLTTCIRLDRRSLWINTIEPFEVNDRILVSMGAFHQKNRRKGPLKRRATIRKKNSTTTELHFTPALKRPQLAALIGQFSARYNAIEDRSFLNVTHEIDTGNDIGQDNDQNWEPLHHFLNTAYHATTSMTEAYKDMLVRRMSAKEGPDQSDTTPPSSDLNDEIEIRSAYDEQVKNDTLSPTESSKE